MDRLMIVNKVFPGTGNYESLIIRKDILDKVQFTQEEVEAYNLKTDEKTGGVTWDCDKDFDYDFTAPEKEEMRKELTKLSKGNKLTAEHMHLYELFVVSATAEKKEDLEDVE